VERKCTTSPNPFSLQGEGEPELFLVPLSFARRGARGEVFNFSFARRRGARVVSCSPLLCKERG
jgi:hypothetical protein